MPVNRSFQAGATVRGADAVGDVCDNPRIGVERRLSDRRGLIGLGILKMKHAKPRGVRDCVCAAGRVELVEDLADMEFGGVNRDA
jgi:hypothetical protein